MSEFHGPDFLIRWSLDPFLSRACGFGINNPSLEEMVILEISTFDFGG